MRPSLSALLCASFGRITQGVTQGVERHQCPEPSCAVSYFIWVTSSMLYRLIRVILVLIFFLLCSVFWLCQFVSSAVFRIRLETSPAAPINPLSCVIFSSATSFVTPVCPSPSFLAIANATRQVQRGKRRILFRAGAAAFACCCYELAFETQTKQRKPCSSTTITVSTSSC